MEVGGLELQAQGVLTGPTAYSKLAAFYKKLFSRLSFLRHMELCCLMC